MGLERETGVNVGLERETGVNVGLERGTGTWDWNVGLERGTAALGLFRVFSPKTVHVGIDSLCYTPLVQV